MSKWKWEYRFLNLAEHLGGWSKDPGAKVGCVIVNAQNRILSTGFNGPPHGVQDRKDMTRDEKLLVTLHAEENAILFATTSLVGARAFINYPPCSLCAARMIQVGIKEIHYFRADNAFAQRWAEQLLLAKKLCDEAGLPMFRYTVERQNEFA